VADLQAPLSSGASLLWSMEGDRGPQVGPYSRNVVGFFDGIVGPSAEQRAAALWVDPATGWPGATIAVVRLMPVDVTKFGRLSVTKQEAVFGRRKDNGAPLSGAAVDDPVDLTAKSEDGVYDIPVRSHARAAHPLVSGAKQLMLRRSYNYQGPDESGLIFISFQHHLDIFVQTQYSLEERDALLEFTHTRRSGTFLVLPAPTAERGLGDWLTS
jgi:dye decolorizing peroxidase